MDIDDLLARDGIVLGVGAASKRQALHQVADVAARALRTRPQKLFEALMEREALGSTGLGSGVAVPHARVEGLEKVSAVFLRLEHPVAWGAVDDRPADLLFALFAPPSDGAEHLRALAAASRALRAPALREQLRKAETIDGVRALFIRDEARAA